MRKKSRACLGSLIVLSACASFPQEFGSLPTVSRGALRHDLVQTLKERNESVRTLRGLATVRFGGRIFGGRRDAAIALKGPDELRIEGLGELGLGGVRWMAKAGEILVIWGNENRYFKGLASRDEMERTLSVSLDPGEVVRFLSGGVPLEDEDRYLLKIARRKGKGEAFLLRGDRGELAVEKKDALYLPVRYTAFDVDGSRDYTVDFSGLEETDGIWFPRRIECRFFSPASRVEIRFHEVDLNPGIDEKLFQLKVPDDATPVDR